MDCAGAYRVFSTRGAPDYRGRSCHEQDSSSSQRSRRCFSRRNGKSFPAYAGYRRYASAQRKGHFVSLTAVPRQNSRSFEKKKIAAALPAAFCYCSDPCSVWFCPDSEHSSAYFVSAEWTRVGTAP